LLKALSLGHKNILMKLQKIISKKFWLLMIELY